MNSHKVSVHDNSLNLGLEYCEMYTFLIALDCIYFMRYEISVLPKLVFSTIPFHLTAWFTFFISCSHIYSCFIIFPLLQFLIKKKLFFPYCAPTSFLPMD